MTAPRPAVFLDRDGVLNDVRLPGCIPLPPADVSQVRILPGVVEGCQRLRDLGYVLVVVTNQPDIARGRQTREEVDRINAVLRDRIALDAIVVCPHDDSDDCPCRKPRPGMLLDAARRFGLDLTRSFCVGDRWRDIEAARRAGVRGIHIDRRYAERAPAGAEAVVAGLPEAVSYIQSHLVPLEI